jgi:pilus assembly protein CpaB
VVRALTLEVTPKEAECLVQAMRTGALQFTLRNPMDTDTYIEPTNAQPVSAPIQTKIVKPYKAPVSIKILPWGSQAFTDVQCQNDSHC